jgi:hypothetical protein
MASPDMYELQLLVTPHARDSAGKGPVEMIETGEGECAADGGDPKLEKTVMS